MTREPEHIPMDVGQTNLFPNLAQTPEGFIYRADIISAGEEQQLIPEIKRLQFGPVKMHGVVARRRTAHFGKSYDFETFKLGPAPGIPAFLLPLRERAGELAGREAADFGEVLVTEYPPGASIGWHRDAPAFGVIVGISLLAECRVQFRPWPSKRSGDTPGSRRGKPISHLLAPRSAYLISGPARDQWQHHIPAIKALRYSITFRTLRNPADR